MEIKRDYYLNQLIEKKEDGMVKIITGIRRCGKSYLLDPIFKGYLIDEGVDKEHIIKIELDRASNIKYHKNPELLEEHIHSMIKDEKMYYVILDEIQLVDGFEFVVSGLLYERNVDVYITGRNSKFLSSDIITEFRGRGEQIHINPLSFSEFYPASKLDKMDAWNGYLTYGGMPLVLTKKSENEKSIYLKNLFEQTYLSDIVERNGIKRLDIMEALTNILASSIGSLTNPKKYTKHLRVKAKKNYH